MSGVSADVGGFGDLKFMVNLEELSILRDLGNL